MSAARSPVYHSRRWTVGVAVERILPQSWTLHHRNQHPCKARIFEDGHRFISHVLDVVYIVVHLKIHINFNYQNENNYVRGIPM